jgi:hypothetical protein
VEETQETTISGMNVDTLIEEQGRQNEGMSSQAKPVNPEEAPRVNGTTTNKEALVELDEYHTTVSDHPQEGAVEDVMVWSKKYAKERPMEVGTSSHPPP